MRKIAILGSTGSIGRQCLSVVESLPARFSVVALAAGENLEQLAAQVLRHRPQLVSVADATRADQLAARLRSASGSQRMDALPEVSWGSKGLEAVATHCEADMVVSAAVGVVGLEATYAAVRHGKQVALSNKEVDRKSTRLNSSHLGISYAVFCLKKKKKKEVHNRVQ